MAHNDFKKRCLKGRVHRKSKTERLISRDNKVGDAIIESIGKEIKAFTKGQSYCINKVSGRYSLKGNSGHVVKRTINPSKRNKSPKVYQKKNPYDEDGEYMVSPNKERNHTKK